MARRRILDEHDNPDRWLVSYADFITLLFAFFVVMYAISTVNENKYRVFSDALVDAFGKGQGGRQVGVPAVEPVRAPPARRKDYKQAEEQRKRQEKMQNIGRDILKTLAPLIKEGQVRVTQSNLGVAVEISSSLLFAPGQAVLEERAANALKAVAGLVRQEPLSIQVEGHTDNVPINTSVFGSNWELSALRSTSVVRLLSGEGIDPVRLSAVGYGENRPVEKNDSPEGRARNRRVTLMILYAAPDRVTDLPIKVDAQ